MTCYLRSKQFKVIWETEGPDNFIMLRRKLTVRNTKKNNLELSLHGSDKSNRKLILMFDTLNSSYDKYAFLLSRGT